MRDFFKYAFASFVALVLFVTLGIGTFIALLVVFATANQNTGPDVADKTILTYDLSLNVSDTKAVVSPTALLSSPLSEEDLSNAIALRTLLRTLDAAANDDRIVGLYLYGNLSSLGNGAGLANLKEIRQALQTFQAAGKPIVAYEATWSERDYYLTSLADTVVLSPTGLMEINGFRSETTFFTGALEKYGVGIQVVRAGQFKSAVEPFLRADNSPQSEQQVRQLLSELWNDFLTTTAQSRSITPQTIQTLADTQGTVLAKDALEQGLVDQLAYFDELLPQLRTLTEQEKTGESFRQVSVSTYAEVAVSQPDQGNRNGAIAIVYAEGDIVSGEGNPDQIGGDRFSRLLRELRRNPKIKAIVLRINSPGGSATASELIAREVRITNQTKPIIVSMGNVTASGGYQMAAHATQIFAQPTTITGSIGVFGILPNVQRLANDNGITWDTVETARFANSDTIARPKTPEELAINQRIVNQIYGQFIATVAEARSLSPERVEEIAQGQVWSGTQAKQIGLVDEWGGLEAAIAAAAAQAKLGDRFAIEEFPVIRSFEEQILRRLLGDRANHAAMPVDPFSLEWRKLRANLSILFLLNDPKGAYSRLPFNPYID